MPTLRKYASGAQRQTAYRQRLARAKHTHQAPAWPTKPGYRRWEVMTKQVKEVLDTALTEMQDYFDERSDAWLESDRAQALSDRIDVMTEAIDALERLDS